MRNDKLSVHSMDFAVSIINLVKALKKRESIISNQIGRSDTSIGANICEAQYARDNAALVSHHASACIFLRLDKVRPDSDKRTKSSILRYSVS